MTTQTPILNYEDDAVQQLLGRINSLENRSFLREAYGLVSSEIMPIYTVDERQTVSETIRKGRGSCSQRMAVVEALARAHGIQTRVRVWWIRGSFWYKRFPRWTHPFIPHRIMLIMPQFDIDGHWLDITEVIAPLETLAEQSEAGFTNTRETLFEAIGERPVDFEGRLAACGCGFDLSHQVINGPEIYATRDEVLARYGSFQDTWRGKAFERLFGSKASYVKTV